MNKNENIRERIRGSILGAAIGDALGGPLEFASPKQVRRQAGTDMWIRELLPYKVAPGPHGVWAARAPAGCATDDTRLRMIFLDAASRRGVFAPADLAREYVYRYSSPGRFYPGYARIARAWLKEWVRAAKGLLGKRCGGIPSEAARASSWGGMPVCAGLLAASSAGLLYPGKPKEAYRAGFAFAFHDVGYARDATGLCAGLIAAALTSNSRNPRQVRALARRIIRIDPYGLGGVSLVGRPMADSLLRAVALAERSRTAHGLVRAWGIGNGNAYPFDPKAIMGAAVAAVCFAGADFRKALTIAANFRELDGRGRMRRMCDTDTIAGVAGAIAGALAGDKGLPAAWREQVLAVNQVVYGVDLAKQAARFVRRRIAQG